LTAGIQVGLNIGQKVFFEKATMLKLQSELVVVTMDGDEKEE
jgi:hypothetical protein